MDHTKRRTRQHVIADQSVNHVERFIIDQGYTTQRQQIDYGYDLVLYTYDENGFAEPGLIYLQLKASESLVESDGVYKHDLDIRDYNLWMMEPFPVLLVLFDAARRRAYWLQVQKYFKEETFSSTAQGSKIRARSCSRESAIYATSCTKNS